MKKAVKISIEINTYLETTDWDEDEMTERQMLEEFVGSLNDPNILFEALSNIEYEAVGQFS